VFGHSLEFRVGDLYCSVIPESIQNRQLVDRRDALHAVYINLHSKEWPDMFQRLSEAAEVVSIILFWRPAIQL
jgi:hypothetical protein